MTKFVRVDGSIVAEIIRVNTPLKDTFHPEIVKNIKEAPDEVEEGWVYSEGKFAPPKEAPNPDPVIIVNALDLWSRMQDDEADQVGEAMASQSFRIRQIFQSATTYRSDHELWPLLTSIAEGLFGKNRASEILAPSTGT